MAAAPAPGPSGERITQKSGVLHVPPNPVIPFIEGDGTGRDIWRAARRVLDAAVAAAYGDTRRISWLEILAGEKAFNACGEWLPQATLDAIRGCRVAIKGPLTTPVGGGIRSLNVALRQALDLYACIRPVRYFPGVPSPMKEPQRLNVVIFRENTEDVYAGLEWPAGSAEARKLISFIRDSFGAKVADDAGIGIKPMSRGATERLARMAIRYAIKNGRKRVTVMHKGNIMKFTEGAFRQWTFDLAEREFKDLVAFEADLGGAPPADRILINDRIADITFQHVLLRPEEFSVIVTPNLNGDYLSDACAAQVGGLGLAPGANIGDEAAVFEATHGTAPKYADQDAANPTAVIMSGAMMLEHLGWTEASGKVGSAVASAIAAKIVTYDLARQMEGATRVRTSEFGDALVERMK